MFFILQLLLYYKFDCFLRNHMDDFLRKYYYGNTNFICTHVLSQLSTFWDPKNVLF